MSRRDDLSPDDRHIWARVAGSVTPRKPKKALLITPGVAVFDPAAAPYPKGLTRPRPTPPGWSPPAPAPARRSRAAAAAAARPTRRAPPARGPPCPSCRW